MTFFDEFKEVLWSITVSYLMLSSWVGFSLATGLIYLFYGLPVFLKWIIETKINRGQLDCRRKWKEISDRIRLIRAPIAKDMQKIIHTFITAYSITGILTINGFGKIADSLTKYCGRYGIMTPVGIVLDWCTSYYNARYYADFVPDKSDTDEAKFKLFKAVAMRQGIQTALMYGIVYFNIVGTKDSNDPRLIATEYTIGTILQIIMYNYYVFRVGIYKPPILNSDKHKDGIKDTLNQTISGKFSKKWDMNTISFIIVQCVIFSLVLIITGSDSAASNSIIGFGYFRVAAQEVNSNTPTKVKPKSFITLGKSVIFALFIIFGTINYDVFGLKLWSIIAFSSTGALGFISISLVLINIIVNSWKYARFLLAMILALVTSFNLYNYFINIGSSEISNGLFISFLSATASIFVAGIVLLAEFFVKFFGGELRILFSKHKVFAYLSSLLFGFISTFYFILVSIANDNQSIKNAIALSITTVVSLYFAYKESIKNKRKRQLAEANKVARKSDRKMEKLQLQTAYSNSMSTFDAEYRKGFYDNNNNNNSNMLPKRDIPMFKPIPSNNNNNMIEMQVIPSPNLLNDSDEEEKDEEKDNNK